MRHLTARTVRWQKLRPFELVNDDAVISFCYWICEQMSVLLRLCWRWFNVGKHVVNSRMHGCFLGTLQLNPEHVFSCSLRSSIPALNSVFRVTRFGVPMNVAGVNSSLNIFMKFVWFRFRVVSCEQRRTRERPLVNGIFL